MSLPEVLLWRELKSSDLKFRKQHPIGPFIADFYCAAAKLALEVDGIAHEMGQRPQKDAARDRFIRARNIDIVRIPAKDILVSPVEVAEQVVGLCSKRIS